MNMTGIEIKCTETQKEALLDIMSDGLKLGKIYTKDAVKKDLEDKIKWIVLECGSITDEEIDTFGKFDEFQKDIIKEQYAKYPKGFFANPMCALY